MSSSACHDGPSNNEVDKAPGSPVNVAGSSETVVGASESTPIGSSVADAAPAGTSMATRVEGITPVMDDGKVETPVKVATTEPAAVDTTIAKTPSKPKKKKINPGRCGACRKKIGLLGFKCQCGVFFCAAHRMAETHECTFDYKSTGRETLAKNNVPVLASKVVKI